MAAQLPVDAAPRRSRLARSRLVAGALAVAVLLAWALFLRGQLVELARFPWRVAPLALIAAVGIGACYFAALAFAWAFLLRQVAQPRAGSVPPDRLVIGLGDAARIWLLSMLTRYVPGNVWHILSRVALARQLGVGGEQVLASATIEQVLTLLGGLALWGITLPFWPIFPAERLWLLLLVPLGMAALHPAVLGRLLAWIAIKGRRPALAWRYTFGELLVMLSCYVGANLLAGLALVALLWGMVPVAWSDLPLLVGASALAWAVGYLSFFTPSGLGVREAVLVALLAQLYPTPIAVVAPLLFRVALTLGEVLAAGGAYVARRGRRFQEG